MIDPNRELLESAADLLRPLLSELVFVGGCATGLLITDPGSGGVRATNDVDASVELSGYGEYATLSEKLRGLGLTEDREVICRWHHGRLLIDVMPTDEKILGFANRWYPPAVATAAIVNVTGARIRLITAPYFIATKLVAYHGRGGGDIAGSHDLEDLIAVVDGRKELVDELAGAAADVRDFIAAEIRLLLDSRVFQDALPGFLLPDATSQARLPPLLERLRALAGLGRLG
jgi:predicted nucleotidyltransferase